MVSKDWMGSTIVVDLHDYDEVRGNIYVPLILDFTVSSYGSSFLYQFCAVDSSVEFYVESSQNVGILDIFWLSDIVFCSVFVLWLLIMVLF